MLPYNCNSTVHGTCTIDDTVKHDSVVGPKTPAYDDKDKCQAAGGVWASKQHYYCYDCLPANVAQADRGGGLRCGMCNIDKNDRAASEDCQKMIRENPKMGLIRPETINSLSKTGIPKTDELGNLTGETIHPLSAKGMVKMVGRMEEAQTATPGAYENRGLDAAADDETTTEE